MTFAGDVPQDSVVQLMKANFDRLIGGASDAALAGSVITPAAAAGVVTLSGTVPTEGAKTASEAAAKSAPGGDPTNLNWITPEGLTVKPLYTAADTRDLPLDSAFIGFGRTGTMFACEQAGITPDVISSDRSCPCNG